MTLDHPPPPPPAPANRGVWGFWGTLLWGAAVYVAFNAAQLIVLLLMEVGNGSDVSVLDQPGGAMHGVTLSLVTIGALPAVLAVLAVAVRLSGLRFADYLALRGFERRDLTVGIALIAIYLPLISLLAHLTGRPVTPQVVVDTYATARDAGAVILLVVAICVAGPMSEEFAVRGFLMRGWDASWLGPAGAVLLTAALWALMHVQYDWFFIGEIFGAGVIFGTMRLRSGSTWLTVVLHGVYNLAAIVQAAIVERMG
jgi:uncharacterized protein